MDIIFGYMCLGVLGVGVGILVFLLVVIGGVVSDIYCDELDNLGRICWYIIIRGLDWFCGWNYLVMMAICYIQHIIANMLGLQIFSRHYQQPYLKYRPADI